MLSIYEVAQLGYEAYADHSGNKNYAGEPLKTFDEIAPVITGHWEAAVHAIANAILSSGIWEVSQMRNDSGLQQLLNLAGKTVADLPVKTTLGVYQILGQVVTSDQPAYFAEPHNLSKDYLDELRSVRVQFEGQSADVTYRLTEPVVVIAYRVLHYHRAILGLTLNVAYMVIIQQFELWAGPTTQLDLTATLHQVNMPALADFELRRKPSVKAA